VPSRLFEVFDESAYALVRRTDDCSNLVTRLCSFTYGERARNALVARSAAPSRACLIESLDGPWTQTRALPLRVSQTDNKTRVRDGYTG
jgi:hypothetical protein